MSTARAAYPDALRGGAILMVAAIHGFAYLNLPVTGVWAAPWFLVHEIAVPAFFLADGWIFATGHRAPVRGREAARYLSASARRLMLPWAIFSVLYLLFRLAGERAGVLGGATVLPDGLASVPLALWRGAAAGHLYFLPALLVVRAATLPLHALVAGRKRPAAILALGLIVLWRGVLEPYSPPAAIGVEPLLAAATGLGFAALGWALAEAEPAWRAPLAAGVVCALAALVQNGRAAETLAQAGYLLLAWSAARCLTGNTLHRAAAWLGQRTMQIFLLHSPVAIKLICDALLHTRLPGAAALVLAVAGSVAAALAAAAVLARLGLAGLWGAKPPAR